MYRTQVHLLLAFVMLPFAASAAANEHYLLFPPRFHVNEITQLGPLPMLVYESLLKKFAERDFEKLFTEARPVTLVPLRDVVGIDDNKAKESLALLRHATGIVRSRLDPEEEDDFFDERTPHLTIGSAFREAKTAGGAAMQYGLSYAVVQYYYDDVRTRRLFGGTAGEGFMISACIVSLRDGRLIECRVVSRPGDTLLHRVGYFKGPLFIKLVKDMLSDDRHIVLEAS